MDIKTDDLLPVAPQVPSDSGTELSGPVTPQTEAFTLYMRDHLTPSEIAITLKRDFNEVLRWFRQGRWVTRKRELDMVRVEAAQQARKVLVAENAVKVVKQQLEDGERAEKILRGAMEDAETSRLGPRDLKFLMDAFAAATSIRAKIVGISDKLPQEAPAAKEQPLLIINAPPPVPAEGPKEVEPINVGENEANQ